MKGVLSAVLQKTLNMTKSNILWSTYRASEVWKFSQFILWNCKLIVELVIKEIFRDKLLTKTYVYNIMYDIEKLFSANIEEGKVVKDV